MSDLERPRHGGCYRREPDGTLVRVDNSNGAGPEPKPEPKPESFLDLVDPADAQDDEEDSED